MTTGSETGENGFILLETIIAFAILSIALAIGAETISQSVRTFLRAGDIAKASLVLDGLAAGQMNRIGEAGVLTGTAGVDASWRISSERLPDGDLRPLLAITVTIWPRGPEGPHFTYHTFSNGAATQ